MLNTKQRTLISIKCSKPNTRFGDLDTFESQPFENWIQHTMLVFNLYGCCEFKNIKKESKKEKKCAGVSESKNAKPEVRRYSHTHFFRILLLVSIKRFFQIQRGSSICIWFLTLQCLCVDMWIKVSRYFFLFQQRLLKCLP